MSASFVEIAFPIPLNRAFHYRVPVHENGADHPLGTRVLAPFGQKKNLVGYVVGKTDQTPAFPTKEILSWLDTESFIDEKSLELARWLSDRYLCSLGEALACTMPPHLMPPKRPRVNDVTHSLTHLLTSSLTLSVEQQNSIGQFNAAIDQRIFKPFLLRGITDSGKTELYLRAIDRTLELKRQAIFLLPEIALTPPFIDHLKTRYSENRVGLWHSGLTPNDRYRTWSRVRTGELQVLLGARSAVFAPFPDLGLIVMDEEHEPSYKQEDRPRYHTREVALKRAEQAHAVLIMGSATPSLESYWKARRGIYTLVELTSRVEQKMLPPVTLIDQRPVRTSAFLAANPPSQPSPTRGEGVITRRRRGSSYESIFSEPLKLALEQRLARREQSMLFVNRRGFTPFMRCSACGWVARCPRCSTTLAWHLKEDVLKTGKEPKDGRPIPIDSILQCHACLHKEKVPIQCPSCKGMRLRNYGIGTQRVEQELKRLFPFVKSARLDRDIVRHTTWRTPAEASVAGASSRSAYEQIYRGFSEGSIDVLIGTQMIAKGFDFPRVTLVGVVDADVSLHLPDFRSSERTFELIAQVAGRTGRGEAKGQVLVQTHHPEHEALQAAQAHDFIAFYEKEIGYREALRYPPFCSLVAILIRGTKEPVVQEAAEGLYQKLQGINPPLPSSVDILGPAPAPYTRLRNQFRYQIILKGTDESLAPYRRFLHSHRLPKAFMSVDVDPVDLL